MSQEKKTPPSIEEKSLTPQQVFLKAGEIATLLIGVSKRQQRDILTLLASQLSLRLAPVGVGLVQPQQSQAAIVAKKEKAAPIVQTPSYDHKDPDLVSMSANRLIIFNQIKTADLADKPSLTVELRKVEASIKDRKKILKGKPEGS